MPAATRKLRRGIGLAVARRPDRPRDGHLGVVRRETDGGSPAVVGHLRALVDRRARPARDLRLGSGSPRTVASPIVALASGPDRRPFLRRHQPYPPRGAARILINPSRQCRNSFLASAILRR